MDLNQLKKKMEEPKDEIKDQNEEDIQDIEPTTEKLPESSEDKEDSNSESNEVPDTSEDSNSDSNEVTNTSEDPNFLTKYSNYILTAVVGIVLLSIFIYALNTSTTESSAVFSDFAKLIQNNSQFTSNLLLIILSLLTLISISISFWLYYWRKLIIADKEIMVPETFKSNIQSLNKVANNNSLNIQNALDNQTAALKSSSKRSDDSNDEIARISKIIAHLQESIEKKEEEMERFKKGYDAEIYHQFLLRFTRVDSVLKEYIDGGTIDLDGLEDIHTQMEDALLECRVESFSPEVGVDYKTQDNIADNPKKTPTTDKDQHEKVEKVVQVGYFRICEDESIEIISKAKVVIYDYAESEKIDESTKENIIKE